MGAGVVGLGIAVGAGAAVGVGVEAEVQEAKSNVPARNSQVRRFIRILLSGEDYTLRRWEAVRRRARYPVRSEGEDSDTDDTDALVDVLVLTESCQRRDS